MQTPALRLRTLTAALALAAAGLAQATSSSPSTPLNTVCPGAEQALQDALAPTIARLREDDSVRVTLQVKGNEVVAVQTSSGSIPYRQAVRRAARALSCDAGVDTARTVNFEVRFAQDGATPANAG